MMTSFRFLAGGPTYYIAMHRDVPNHWILSDGKTVTVDGDLVDGDRGTVFVRTLRASKLDVASAAKVRTVKCGTCKNLGFHVGSNGEIFLPCEECGQYPKEDWL